VTWDDEEVVESVDYDVYGWPTFRDGTGQVISESAISNTLTYTAREWDKELGLYYYRFRTYDPYTGRFLQRDPMGYVDGASLYGYCSARVSCLRDPLGLDPQAEGAKALRGEVAKAAKANSQNPAGWIDDAPANADGDPANDAKNATCPSDSTTWKQQGDGIVAQSGASSAECIEEILANPGKFFLDCSSACWLNWYAGILSFFKGALGSAGGHAVFDQLFPTMLILGAYSAGSPEGNAALAQHGMRIGPVVIVHIDNGPYLAGDQRYVGGETNEAGQPTGEGGENVTQTEDGDTDDTKVAGHSPPDAVGGEHTKQEYEDGCDGKQGWGPMREGATRLKGANH
jgi:RHS repeat-associated protein